MKCMWLGTCSKDLLECQCGQVFFNVGASLTPTTITNVNDISRLPTASNNKRCAPASDQHTQALLLPLLL